MKHTQPLLHLWLFMLLSACGSAEAIKSYSYDTTKDNLEKAVQKVMNTNPHIVIDTTQPQVIVRQNQNNPNDTTTVKINLSDFHSPDSAEVAAMNKGVMKIKIKVGKVENEYIYRYYGNEQYWKSSKTSAIFI